MARAWTVPVLLLLLALAPLAAADQDHSVGPAALDTQNASGGDGDCDASNGDGYESRYLWAGVDATEHESVGVMLTQSCSTWSWNDGVGDNTEEWASGSVQVGRFSDGNPGPVVGLYYTDHRYAYGAYEGHSCSTAVTISGSPLMLGCFPNGERWPMLPTLP